MTIKPGDKIRSLLSGQEYVVGKVGGGIVYAGWHAHNPFGWAFLDNECEKVEEKAVEFQVGDKVTLPGTINWVDPEQPHYVDVKFGDNPFIYTTHVSRVVLVERPEKEIPLGTSVEYFGGVWVLGGKESNKVWVKTQSVHAGEVGGHASDIVTINLNKIARESL